MNLLFRYEDITYKKRELLALVIVRKPDIIYVQKHYNPLAFSRLHEIVEQTNNKKTFMPRPNLNLTSRNCLFST